MSRGLAGFLLVEDYDADEPVERDLHGDDLAIPARDRRPIDAGFVLTWREYPRGGGRPRERTGMVLSLAPPSKSVWVVPDDPDPDDGYAVLVREVTKDDASRAERRVGSPGDYVSSADWQSPRSLPRAWLRIDTVDAGGDAGPRLSAHLHADPDCTYPRPFKLMNITVERGEPTRAEECYVFGRHLHPASHRPAVPGAMNTAYDAGAQPCGSCLQHGRPI